MSDTKEVDTKDNIEKTLADFAREFNEDIGNDLDAILRRGKMLIAVKESVPNGEFLRMFSDHANAIKEPIKINSRYAADLMKVARGIEKFEDLTFNRHSHLPPNIDTLRSIFKKDMDASSLKTAVENGLKGKSNEVFQ